MPFVFYTNQEFAIGKTFQTSHLSAANWRAIEGASPKAVEIEEFLEAVRRENFQDAPPRMESISAIPWPEKAEAQDYQETEKRKKTKYITKKAKERMPDPAPPPGGAYFCYYISNPGPRNGTVMWMVDEAVVQELAQRWREIADTEEAVELAMEYWGGQGGLVQGSIYFLIHGPVQVDAICEGGLEFGRERPEEAWSAEEIVGEFWRPLAEDADL